MKSRAMPRPPIIPAPISAMRLPERGSGSKSPSFLSMTIDRRAESRARAIDFGSIDRDASRRSSMRRKFIPLASAAERMPRMCGGAVSTRLTITFCRLSVRGVSRASL